MPLGTPIVYAPDAGRMGTDYLAEVLSHVAESFFVQVKLRQ